jgi:thiol:disulfide interchange protein DsbD
MATQRRRSWQYVTGVMSVFFCLGVAATGPGFIWGGQFEHWWFTWVTAAVVFALGLTYLDVWHLPNFGFREAQSDFGKGVLTTLLSSACSGQFLGAVFAASLTEPPLKIITLFMLIGLGLVTPYLLFPRNWIPRPGAWMETVKRLAGTAYADRLLVKDLDVASFAAGD